MTSNKYGFPLEDCARCSGTGNHSYNAMSGSICFGCKGKGVTVARHAKRAWVAFCETQKRASTRPVAEIKVGDTVLIAQRGKLTPRVVLEVSSSSSRDMIKNVEIPMTVLHLEGLQYGVYADAEIRVPLTEAIDPAPFLATIKEPK